MLQVKQTQTATGGEDNIKNNNNNNYRILGNRMKKAELHSYTNKHRHTDTQSYRCSTYEFTVWWLLLLPFSKWTVFLFCVFVV